jgi:hypothetical protein
VNRRHLAERRIGFSGSGRTGIGTPTRNSTIGNGRNSDHLRAKASVDETE